MQTPNTKTSVSKCLELGAYTPRMCEKFPTNATLKDVALKLSAATKVLDDAQTDYAKAVQAILPTRVDVKYENFRSDRRIRLTQQRVEQADGVKSGKLGALVFPEGSSKIIRMLGQSQVDAMIALEGRLDALKTIWPDSVTETQEIGACHKAYQAAINGRTLAGQAAAALRAVRDVAKDSWLTVYIESQHRVEVEYPRDTTMQELFFDEVRTPSAAADADTSEPAPLDPSLPLDPKSPGVPPVA